MIDFSTIAQQLKVKIAEMMNFWDQAEFAMSSKHGTDVLNLTKHKSVVDVFRMEIYEENTHMELNEFIGTDRQCISSMNLSQILQYPSLPRFKVSRLIIQEGATLNTILELGENIDLFHSEVNLDWRQSELPFSIFTKLNEIFHIKRMRCSVCEKLDVKVFSHPLFLEMDFLDIPITGIPQENLLMLQAQSLILEESSDRGIDFVANLFFRMWFLKERKIEWFRISHSDDEPSMDEEILLFELPGNHEMIWNGEDNQKKSKITFLNTKDSAKEYNISEVDTIFSLDRGDKKLLILFSLTHQLIIAQENTELKDIIEIETIEVGKRRGVTRKRTRGPDQF